jgi:hypothetical protein
MLLSNCYRLLGAYPTTYHVCAASENRLLIMTDEHKLVAVLHLSTGVVETERVKEAFVNDDPCGEAAPA